MTLCNIIGKKKCPQNEDNAGDNCLHTYIGISSVRNIQYKMIPIILHTNSSKTMSIIYKWGTY